eukprot:TRINITY_DN780173_c0_g1_i1.p1 TRINITY_DN780173_c0_g1~~TRINITY_DN780173_c0_g1_i1.p1  ORF type:complete len:185 (+),score=40.85 TRINITY_DN780173_c0_g1_i1:123-677(+)
MNDVVIMLIIGMLIGISLLIFFSFFPGEPYEDFDQQTSLGKAKKNEEDKKPKEGSIEEALENLELKDSKEIPPALLEMRQAVFGAKSDEEVKELFETARLQALNDSRKGIIPKGRQSMSGTFDVAVYIVFGILLLWVLSSEYGVDLSVWLQRYMPVEAKVLEQAITTLVNLKQSLLDTIEKMFT